MCIIDAIAVVQDIIKGPSVATCLDFVTVYSDHPKNCLYDKGNLVFDC